MLTFENIDHWDGLNPSYIALEILYGVDLKRMK